MEVFSLLNQIEKMTPLSHAQKAIEKHGTKITAKEFLEMIGESPSVFEHWNTPLEITEYVLCINSPITSLSKHLTFSGKNEDGKSASFLVCHKLKTATGTFHGSVEFSDCGIQKIEELTITQTDNKAEAASFAGCQSLEIATGTYPGAVNFSGTGIHSIQNLHIENPNKTGEYATFIACPLLKNLGDWDLSKKIGTNPEKIAAEKERRALEKFYKTAQPDKLPFL